MAELLHNGLVSTKKLAPTLVLLLEPLTPADGASEAGLDSASKPICSGSKQWVFR
jgi:hypothetical protein